MGRARHVGLYQPIWAQAKCSGWRGGESTSVHRESVAAVRMPREALRGPRQPALEELALGFAPASWISNSRPALDQHPLLQNGVKPGIISTSKNSEEVVSVHYQQALPIFAPENLDCHQGPAEPGLEQDLKRKLLK